MSEDFPAFSGLAPGSRVAGYRLEEPLGAGGMAVVYRARDERLGRLVALKVLAPALAADGEFRRRFTAESRAAAAVDHPHIIPVHEAGQADRVLFIAMRLVNGGDLRQVLAREGPLPPERAAQFLSPVASALDTAHGAGLVHRDVKPANILVDSGQGRPDHVYLSDFGISKGAASTAGLTGTGQYLGTPEYTSPEQVNGQAVDGRADQYALACVAWHLLTGTVPFQRDQGLAVLLAHLNQPPPSLAEWRPDLPAAAGHVLATALAKEPGERYSSCGEFTDALREALALPRYQPATPPHVAAAPAAAGHPGTEISDLPVPPATAGAGTASGPDRPAPDPGTPADKPTEDIAVPGQRIRSGPGPDGNPARPARRRRYLTITLAGTLLAAAAAAIPLLLTRPGAPQTTASQHTRTPTVTPAASRNTPAASRKKTEPAARSVPLTGALTATLTDPASNSSVSAVAFAPGGTTLAVGDLDGSAYLWDTATETITATLTDPSSTGADAVAFAPGGTTLAVGDGNGSTYLWDTATETITATLTDPNSQGVLTVAFAPGGTTLAADDVNGSTYLWDTATGKLTATLPGNDGWAVAFAPGGATVATGDENGNIHLWDTATGKLTATLTDPDGANVHAVAFAPGGATLAVGDNNGNTYGSTYLWDTATRTITANLTDPGSHGVFAVAFAPGGTTLAAGDNNGNTYLWDIATGTITATLADPAIQGGINGVKAVAFAPGGTTLATGDLNGRTCLWHITRRSP